MKLRAITGRGELRGYFDLMVIERTGRLTETGVALFVDKFCRESTDTSDSVHSVVMALGYLGDVDDDPALPVTRDEIEKYWHRRQPAIIRHLDRYGLSAPMPNERPRPT